MGGVLIGYKFLGSSHIQLITRGSEIIPCFMLQVLHVSSIYHCYQMALVQVFYIQEYVPNVRFDSNLSSNFHTLLYAVRVSVCGFHWN